MKRILLLLVVLLISMLACGRSVTTKAAEVTVFVDESGQGALREAYRPVPNTLVMAQWNQHGGMYREVRLTDQNGKAYFSVEYTDFFDISAFPPCGYYSTTALQRDVTEAETAEFGFWPADPNDQLSRVKFMVWRDVNSNGVRDPQEELTDEKASVMFHIPNGMNGNVFDQDNFVQQTRNGWFDVNLGNSCGTIYVLLLNSQQQTASVSEPGKASDAGSHGNTHYPSIEIRYSPGETTLYWEIKQKEGKQ